MQLWLSEDEVRELTGMQKPKSQMRVLDTLGYRYRERGDGTFIVPIYNNIIDQLPQKQHAEYPMDFSCINEKA